MRWLRRLRDALAALRAQDEAEMQLRRGESARLRAALATMQELSWMHTRKLSEDRTRRAEAAREQRLAGISTEATAVYATEVFRWPR